MTLVNTRTGKTVHHAPRPSVAKRRRGPQRLCATLLACIVGLSGVLVSTSAEARRPRLRLTEDGRGLLHSYSATLGVIVNQSGDFN